MKKFYSALFISLISVLTLSACSDNDDGKEDEIQGKGAKYKVVFNQSGDHKSYSKILVIAANGSPLYDDIKQERVAKTAFNEEDMTEDMFSISTEKKALQFQVVASVLDLNDAPNASMTWEVIIYKDDKEIDRRKLNFEDGHTTTSHDLNLYFD